MLVLQFEINFKSNYHFGAGFGKGFNLDSALLREADGKAVIRGTALSGLLRDGARRLLELPVMAKHQSNENEIMGRLFGDTDRIKHWRIDSAYPIEERVDDSQTVQRVRIDPVTRRAEPKKLFSQEEGVAGQVFRFMVTCPDQDGAILDEAALLVAAARNVRLMGRSRRRGLGECVIHLTAVEGVDEGSKSDGDSWESYFLKRFDLVWLKGAPGPIVKRAIKSEISSIETQEEKPIKIRVIAWLNEPLLVSRHGPAGNQFETNLFIPGSVILGALAAKAAGNCDLACPDTYRDFVALFRRNGIKFPMLYPAHYFRGNIYPSIPAPLGLMTCSLNPFWKAPANLGHGLYPARVIKESNGLCPECHNKLEPLDNKFLYLKRDMGVYDFKQTTEMHIKINSKTQRVNKGDLFEYTVLEAGQYFTGDLVCANENVWEMLQKMSGAMEKTPQVLYLGKGRQRGYGRVTIWLECFESHAPTWIQKPLEERLSDPKEEICLTFLTDTIIVEPWGRQAAGLSARWLEPTLGLGPLEIKDAYVRTRTVDSFNTTLGLPRWRDLALTGGSTVWLQLKNPPLDWMARMQKLEAKGIGLRRSEGFGCIAFNHPIYEHYEDIRSSAIHLDLQMKKSMQPSPNLFNKRWEEELDKAFEQYVDDPRYASLGRWLYINSGKAPEELKRILEEFGNPDKEAGFIDAVGGIEEYGVRRETIFFNEEQKKEVFSGLLDRLQEKDQSYWRPGIERLAERIVRLSGKKGRVSDV